MTGRRKLMLEEFERRNFTDSPAHFRIIEGFAILLRQDAEAALARGGNALPEEENAAARDFEPG